MSVTTATSGPATSRRGCSPTTGPAPITGCAPTCAATPTTDEVDLVVVGAGAGGSVLTQRLARAGWTRRLPGRRPVLGPRHRLGQRRTRLAHPVLDRAAADRRHRPGPVGLQQLRPRRRRLDGPLRRVHPPVPPVGLPHPHRTTGSAPTGRSATPTSSRYYEQLEAELPVAGQDWPWGDPHRYPHHAAPGRRQRRDLPARRARRRHRRPGSARSRSPTAASGTGRTASTAASACRAARSTPRPAR